MAKFLLAKIWWIVIVIVAVIVVVVVLVFFVFKKDDNNLPAGSSSASSVTASTKIIPLTTFTNGLGGWYEQVWYTAKSSGGEVTTGANGVTFTGIDSNSRSGIMIELNKSVSGFSKVTISASGVVNSQTLSGTGNSGREAPVAIAVAYKDAKGAEHNLLGENPVAAGQMFWRGFYYIDPSGSAGKVNGVKVTQNKKFTFTFDLMTLSPKPKTIEYVSLEGAGWKTRQGSISSFSVTAE